MGAQCRYHGQSLPAWRGVLLIVRDLRPREACASDGLFAPSSFAVTSERTGAMAWGPKRQGR